MTKVQAEKLFKEEYKDWMKTATKTDKRVAWADFTDYLCKNGTITEKQYNNWGQASFCR